LLHNKQTAMSTYMHLEPFQKAANNGKVEDLSSFTHELRWKKSPAELTLMRESASVACQVLPNLRYCQFWTLQISSC
jgi:Xaa-Pro aminopeptidase